MRDYRYPVEINNLFFRYADIDILSGIHMNVRHGEIRVILGSSGCGKTTILKHIMGILKPTAGYVKLQGVDISHADEHVREAMFMKVGMLFQAGALLNAMTVLENICLPLKERTNLSKPLIEEIAWMKLALVGLNDAAHKMPQELSGGMKKRVALARAIALDPEILLCDEPTAGLDPHMAAKLDELILNLRAQFGMTVIIVSHDLASIANVADNVLMLSKGVVIADGPLDVVKQQNNPIVRAFFNRTVHTVQQQQISIFDNMTSILKDA